jgi:hypothetical protein
LNFTPTAVETFAIDDVVGSRGLRSSVTRTQSFTQFIADTFFPCTVGSPDLVYDQERRILIWLADSGDRVGVQFAVRSRIRVNVAEWRPMPRVIDVNELNEYRMLADPSEILAVSATPSADDIRKAKKALALTYHPDKFDELGALYREIAKRRMQEVNVAAERARKKWLHKK